MSNLAAQSPAQGLMQTGNWPHAKSFRIACECSYNEHAVDAWIEVSKEYPTEITVEFHVNTYSPFWEKSFNRIKIAWNVLMHGYHKQEHHMLLRSQAALNLAYTITSNVTELQSDNVQK